MPYKITYDCFAPIQRRFINIDMFCDDMMNGVDRMNVLKKIDFITTYNFSEKCMF